MGPFCAITSQAFGHRPSNPCRAPRSSTTDAACPQHALACTRTIPSLSPLCRQYDEMYYGQEEHDHVGAHLITEEYVKRVDGPSFYYMHLGMWERSK